MSPQIAICCMFCDQHILDLDSDFTLPLRGEQMTPAAMAKGDGDWRFPAGPVIQDFSCPVCGGFPFGYQDGVITEDVKILTAGGIETVKLTSIVKQRQRGEENARDSGTSSQDRQRQSRKRGRNSSQ